MIVAKYFQREIKIMQSVRSHRPMLSECLLRESRHPNVVQYLGLSLAPRTDPDSSDERQRILIISEFLNGGNMRSYIASPNLPFPWRLRLSFAVDVARAVAYMHARKCMHRDLKPENLLLTENYRVKVCDFGCDSLGSRRPD
jgi:LIM domain kinase 1